MNNHTLDDKVQASVALIEQRFGPRRPRVGIVLGSGWNGVMDSVSWHARRGHPSDFSRSLGAQRSSRPRQRVVRTSARAFADAANR